MPEYWTPLNTVTEDEFDEYLSALETTLEERLEDIPDHRVQMNYDSMGLSYPMKMEDPQALERAVYRNLLDGLDHVEDKTDLLDYSREEVETPRTDFPGPVGTLLDLFNTPFRAEKKLIFQELFDEAKMELRRENLQ